MHYKEGEGERGIEREREGEEEREDCMSFTQPSWSSVSGAVAFHIALLV